MVDVGDKAASECISPMCTPRGASAAVKPDFTDVVIMWPWPRQGPTKLTKCCGMTQSTERGNPA